MTNYNELTDGAINARIKMLIFGEDWDTESALSSIDYCNNWNDAGWLSERYNIGLLNLDCTTLWMAFNRASFNNGIFDCAKFTECTNPKRAIAICVLMMLEGGE